MKFRVWQLTLFVLVIGFIHFGPPAAAQDSRDYSVELLFGYAAGHSTRTDHGTVLGAFDIVIGRRFGHEARIVPLMAVDMGIQGPIGGIDHVCIIDPSEASGCVRAFPAVASIGVLGGITTGRDGLRLAGGPALVHAVLHGQPSEPETTVGLQARAELAFKIFVLSGRGTLVPSYRGDSLRLLSYQIGLRF